MGSRLRWRRLLDHMEENRLDIAVIGSPKNIHYFTGYISAKLFMPSYLLVFREGDPILVTGSDEREQASKNFGGEVIDYVSYRLDTVMRPYPSRAVEASRKALAGRRLPYGSVGYEGWGVDSIMLHELMRTFRDASFTDISQDILYMRMSKDEDELEALRQAAELNDFAYGVARENAGEGRSEVEVYTATYAAIVKKVGGFQFFSGDFVSGERCLQIGGPPTSRRLGRGETLILDLWVVTNQYWSDTCRTFIVGDRPNEMQGRVFEVLGEALRAGEEVLRPGVSGAEVYRAVYGTIEKHGFGRYFTHHAGHGLGLEAWEPPYFIPEDKNVLRENSVCTLEPGIYFREVGGVRLENNYVVKRDGVEVLNKFPLEP